MIQYQIDKNKTSPLQRELERRTKEAPEIRKWKEDIGEQLKQLETQYKIGADESTRKGTKWYIECLIQSIEDTGRECSQKKRYNFIIDKYEKGKELQIINI